MQQKNVVAVCRDIYLLHARLHLVFEPRTKGGAWWRVTTASGVMRLASHIRWRPAAADPRCRTVRTGCKPLHAHSSCLGTTASGQHWGAPITVPVGEPTPPVPAHLRTCAMRQHGSASHVSLRGEHWKTQKADFVFGGITSAGFPLQVLFFFALGLRIQ